jgi:hypothetical protein
MQTGKFTSMIGTLGAALFPITASANITYDAAADFSANSNPSGVWSYGWSQTLGGTFNLDTDAQNLAPGVVQWRGDLSGDGNPSVFENTTASVASFGTITMQPHTLAFHPGIGGQYSIVQFTAPAAGNYAISASFQGDDHGPTSTGVFVLAGNSLLGSGYVNGFGAGTGPSLYSTVHLSTGETVDFAVDYNGGPNGRNGAFYNDSTGLAATITPVPEPTTMVAGALLLLPFGAGALRQLRKSGTA